MIASIPIQRLSRSLAQRTSRAVTTDLFDAAARSRRRDRAAAQGTELFLLDRIFDDCLDRLSLVRRTFGSALIIGCPNPDWPLRLGETGCAVEVFDPGGLFANKAGGSRSDEAALPVEPAAFDLIVGIGTLDTANGLGDVLLRLRLALRPGGLLLGAMSGAETLPRLRAAMRAADEVAAVAAPHVHPRIEPAGLAGLLTDAGFEMPVVDVDRISVSYSSFGALVRDLRGMAATNILNSRSRKPLSKLASAAAARSFEESGSGGNIVEVFEILNFAGWAPESQRDAAKS